MTNPTILQADSSEGFQYFILYLFYEMVMLTNNWSMTTILFP